MESNKRRYNINYGYTTFLAFLLNLRYNGTRKISIESLKAYPRILLNEIKAELSDEDAFTELKNLSITMINDANGFEQNIELNKEIFSIDGEYLVLNDKVSTKDLLKIIDLYDYPFTDFVINLMKCSANIKNILELNGIKDMIETLNDVETLIEEYYLPTENGNKLTFNDKIKLQILMKKRNEFYHALLNASSDTLTDFDDESKCLLEDPYESFYPIDSENNYDCLFEDDVYLTDDVLANPYVIAYFTNHPLSHFRIAEDISNLCLKYYVLGEYDTEEEYHEMIAYSMLANSYYKGKFIYTIRSKAELLFFLTLIKNIEGMKSTASDDIAMSLETSKNRLIYMLDDLYLNLIDSDNLDKVFNDITSKYNNNELYKNEDLFEDESFEIISQFGMLSKVFIYDIFEGVYDDELNKKKLAFIKTYYDLTGDKEILSILNQYCDSPDYWNFTKYIRGNVLKLERTNNGQRN